MKPSLLCGLFLVGGVAIGFILASTVGNITAKNEMVRTIRFTERKHLSILDKFTVGTIIMVLGSEAMNLEKWLPCNGQNIDVEKHRALATRLFARYAKKSRNGIQLPSLQGLSLYGGLTTAGPEREGVKGTVTDTTFVWAKVARPPESDTVRFLIKVK